MSDDEISCPDTSAQVQKLGISQETDAAISACVAKADRDSPGWSARAFEALAAFVKNHPGRRFIAEEFRREVEVAAPHDLRAWGAVFRRAIKGNLIQQVGYRPARSSHLSPKPLWEALS